METWHPRFSYYGFRYIQVEGAVLKGQKNTLHLPVIQKIQSCFVYNSAPKVSTFQCSNRIFNEAHRLIEKAVRSNMQSVFTDCPHREKLGWLEQDHLCGPGLLYNYDLTGFVPQTLQNIADAQHANGAVPTTAPEYVVFEGPLGADPCDLMHCRAPEDADAAPTIQLEDFFTMLRRQHTVDWHSVRTALLGLSIALALWGVLACPGTIAVHWYGLGDGSFRADGWMPSFLIFPLCAGIEFLSLEIWNSFEQTGYYRRRGEINLFIIHAMSFGTRSARWMKVVLDLLFFFCFGFVIPFVEAWMIFLN